ncbi:MAG: hypothetical protein M1827_007648 [Pycnora praestabilis]|nr:MAG: hypothetical protein M1827_007648 [Pycnora praestabilis]
MGNSQGKPVIFTEEVNLNHFRLLRVVGKGAFGKVRIVERKDTGLTFALKYIRKDEVVRSESVRNIIRERRMLEHLNHPFLCNLRYSFQDIEYLYIVVDLMNGGDLRFHISRKTFTEEAVRFWIAELGCALRYIHAQGIVHRDVKPDNILLDSEGHVHLADFNVASDFTPRKLLNSKSGTLAYLAPEVYEGKGYLSEVDWWSLGVTFYECIYNKRPFDAHTQETLVKQIRQANPNFHVTQPPVSMPCLHAISSLLEKDKTKRIGSSGFVTFTQNPFFQPIDFTLLEQKQIAPIFVPSSEKTNFDATYDLEELLLEEAPLEARARRQKPREQLKDDATVKEVREDELHRMIETLFEPFDYTSVAYESPPAAVRVATGPGGSQPNLVNPSNHSKSSTEESGQPPLTPLPPQSPGRQSAIRSPNGSPPLGHSTPSDPSDATAGRSDYFGPAKTNAPPPSYSRPIRAAGGTRNTSQGGGIEMVLEETSSWSGLADQSATIPAEGKEGLKNRPNGMLGFLSRKKGRERSPKPKERGVLGKEGARAVIH